MFTKSLSLTCGNVNSWMANGKQSINLLFSMNLSLQKKKMLREQETPTCWMNGYLRSGRRIKNNYPSPPLLSVCLFSTFSILTLYHVGGKKYPYVNLHSAKCKRSMERDIWRIHYLLQLDSDCKAISSWGLRNWWIRGTFVQEIDVGLAFSSPSSLHSFKYSIHMYWVPAVCQAPSRRFTSHFMEEFQLQCG